MPTGEKTGAKAKGRAAVSVALKVAQVREEVRNRIQQGALLPGERINELALTQELQIGRAMLREALRSLEQAGLVRIIKNRGAEVCKLGLEDALHLYDIRAGLARASGRLIAARITAAEERMLTGLQERMEAMVRERDVSHYHDLNESFHRHLMLAAKNPRLQALNQDVEDELKLYLRKGVYTLAQIQLSIAEHRAILDAVVQGQPEQAAEAFEKHILTGKQRMLDTISVAAIQAA